MSAAIDRPITWRSLIRVGLGWAAEYAVLGLIEDEAVRLKIATVLCAIAALFIMETETWFRQVGRHAFVFAIAIVSVIYLGFVSYAIQHAWHEEEINTELSEFYREGSSLENLPFQSGAALDKQKWNSQIANWRERTASFLENNIDIFVQARFLDTIGTPTLNYNGVNPDISNQINMITTLRKNLETNIDARTGAKK